MGWLKLDDKWDDHPKIVSAGRDGAWLHLRGLLFCARHETDGHVPAEHVARLGSEFSKAVQKRLTERLVQVGLWEIDPDGDGWWIHDYLEYNPSSRRRRADREAAKDRMARAREEKRRRSQHVRPNAPRSSVDVRSTPSRPPIELSESEERSGDAPNLSSLRWAGPDDQDRTYAAEHKPGIDVDVVFEKWVLHCSAQGLESFADPRAAFRKWLLDERSETTREAPPRPAIRSVSTCALCGGLEALDCDHDQAAAG